MKRAFRLAMRPYPSWWRQRYAREVEALLEDMKPGWFELFDVVRGALAMQMRTRLAYSRALCFVGHHSTRDSRHRRHDPELKPDYPLHVASGGGVGLLAGAVALLVMRLRRQ